MPPSRAAANAQLLRSRERRQSATQSQASANKFTQKQSHFELRREEAQVRALRSQQHAALAGVDAPVRERVSANTDFDLRAQRQQAYGAGGTAPEEGQQRPVSLVGGGARAAAVAGSTRQATLGMGTMAVAKAAKTTRTERRVQRYNLSDGGGGGDPARPGAGPATGGLLGVARGPLRGEAAADDAEEGAPAPLTKAERFREVVARSKEGRAQRKREHTELDTQREALDKEINSLVHLLKPRDKIAEEKAAFLALGTPEVKALYADYKRAHGTKVLTLRGGTATVAPLVDDDDQQEEQAEGGEPPAKRRRTGRAPLTAEERALLHKAKSGDFPPSAEELEAQAALATQNQQQQKSEVAVAEQDDEDDFDALLRQMTRETRRAHASEPVLSEEEEAARAAARAVLEADRAAVPLGGAEERERVQLSRREWLEQGGDAAFHMDGGSGADGEEDGNVDLPSSLEASDVEASDVEEEGEGGGAAALARADDGGSEGEAEAGDGDDDEDAAGGAAVASPALEKMMSELEALAASAATAAATVGGNTEEEEETQQRQRQARYQKLLTSLTAYAREHALETAKVFRLVLVEAERAFLLHGRRRQRGGGGAGGGFLTPALLLSLYTITYVFPLSDYRHEVATPFLLFLCSALSQLRLDTLAAVQEYLALAALLTRAMRLSGGKFCAEVVTAPLNVMALQLPRSALEPAARQGVRVPFPLLDRCEAPLLRVSDDHDQYGAEGPLTPAAVAAAAVPLLAPRHAAPLPAPQLLAVAYRLAGEAVELYGHLPAFPSLCARPLAALTDVMAAAGVRPPHGSPHAALTAAVAEAVAAVEARRAPLAMRSFRPRPIRLFEPLLVENDTNAARREVREMKRDMREDKKRLLRHISAEASVVRRAREREAAATDAQRERRYNVLMGQLQAQQHVMNTVDAHMARAKAKPRKGISGAPKASGADAGDGIPEY